MTKLWYWPLLVLVPLQRAVNRSNLRARGAPGFRISSTEIVAMAMGAVVRWAF